MVGGGKNVGNAEVRKPVLRIRLILCVIEAFMARSDTPKKIGVIVVDHGSRRAESNQLLLEVTELFGQSTDHEIVEPAHMELAEPTIEMAFARCVARGAELIIVFPYFLGPGRHWHEDIPRLTADAARKHTDVPFRVASPIGNHRLIPEIISDRIRECLD